MNVGLYARVSSDAQEARGTIGSQLEALRARVIAEGDNLVAEFVDDGCSGARLDRPGLERDLASRPVADIIADLCRDLGVEPKPVIFRWKRRTPDDIAALCARAAQWPPADVPGPPYSSRPPPDP